MAWQDINSLLDQYNDSDKVNRAAWGQVSSAGLQNMRPEQVIEYLQSQVDPGLRPRVYSESGGEGGGYSYSDPYAYLTPDFDPSYAGGVFGRYGVNPEGQVQFVKGERSGSWFDEHMDEIGQIATTVALAAISGGLSSSISGAVAGMLPAGTSAAVVNAISQVATNTAIGTVMNGGDVEGAFKNAAVNTAVQGVGGALSSGAGSVVTDALKDLGVSGDTAGALSKGATTAAVAAATGGDPGTAFISSVVPGLVNSAASSLLPTSPSELDQTLYPSETFSAPAGESFSWSDVPKPIQQALTSAVTAAATGGDPAKVLQNAATSGISGLISQQATSDPTSQAMLAAAVQAGIRGQNLSQAGMAAASAGLGGLFKNRGGSSVPAQQIAAAYADPSRGQDVIQGADYGFGGGPGEGDVGDMYDAYYGAEDFSPDIDYATAVAQAESSPPPSELEQVLYPTTPAPAPAPAPVQTAQEEPAVVEPGEPEKITYPETEGTVAAPDYGPDLDYSTSGAQYDDFNNYRDLLEQQGVQFQSSLDDVLGSVNSLRDLYGGDAEANRMAIEQVAQSTGASIDAINNALNGRVDALAGELSSLRGQVGGIGGDVGALQGQISSLGGDVGSLQQSLDQQISELRALGLSQDEATRTAIQQVSADTGRSIADVQSALQGQISELGEQYSAEIGQLRSEFGDEFADMAERMGLSDEELRNTISDLESGFTTRLGQSDAEQQAALDALRGELGGDISDLESGLLQRMGQSDAEQQAAFEDAINRVMQESGQFQEEVFDEFGNLRQDFLDRLALSDEEQNAALRSAIDQVMQDSADYQKDIFDEFGNLRQDFLGQLTATQSDFGSKIAGLGTQFSDFGKRISDWMGQQSAQQQQAQQAQQAQAAQQSRQSGMLGLLGLLNQPQAMNKVEAAPLANIAPAGGMKFVSPYGESLANIRAAGGGAIDDLLRN